MTNWLFAIILAKWRERWLLYDLSIGGVIYYTKPKPVKKQKIKYFFSIDIFNYL